ncbi:MAG TPA: FAD-dependent oxidoreductase [Pyrinomonadaceae bacterium]|nr:FAD-dependent oxidoreductase [Pyrinomonadaceae bacterium]
MTDDSIDRRAFLRRSLLASAALSTFALPLVAFYPRDEELERVVRAEGRVHFAGEHAPAWPSRMQGARESGHRAAREIGGAAHKMAALNSQSERLLT